MTVTYAAEAAKTSPAPTFIFFGVVVLAFYFLGVRPSRKRMATMQAVQQSLAPGREVVTTAGLYGTVTGIDEADGTLTISIAPGVEAKFARGAIMKVVAEPMPDPMPESIPADGD